MPARKSYTCGRDFAKISSLWVYEISWRGITSSLRKQPFLLLLAAFDILQQGTSGTQQQKFHTDDENQCLHNKSGSPWVPNANLFNFTFLLVDFSFKSVVFICE